MHPAGAAVGGGAVGLPRAGGGAAPAHEHVDEAQLQIAVGYRGARQVVLLMQQDITVAGCASGCKVTSCVQNICKGSKLQDLATANQHAPDHPAHAPIRIVRGDARTAPSRHDAVTEGRRMKHWAPLLNGMQPGSGTWNPRGIREVKDTGGHLRAGSLWRDAVCEGLCIAAGAAVAPGDAEADRAGLVRGRKAAVDPPLQPCGRHLLLVKHDAHGAARADLPVRLPAGHQDLLRCSRLRSGLLMHVQ